jgi:hypothetical protein
MPIDFPSGPTTGQVYTYEGRSWVWNGSAWDAPNSLNEIGAVSVFANSTARSSAIPTPTEGIVTYLNDVDSLQVYSGSSWQRPDVPEFLQVVNSGLVGTNYSFTLNRKFICQFQFSSSGYSATSNTVKTWNLIVGSTTVAQARHYFNPGSTHMTCPVGVGTITLDAGTYSARITSNATTDSGDSATIWATLIPTV